jgi:pyrroloquinoline-quinone synthase
MAEGFSAFNVSTAIDAAVSARAMLSHPFYQAWSEGRLTQDNLAEYAKQYFHHVEAFPRVVSAAHAACPDRVGRRMLAENLSEEEGLEAGKQDHASLWLQFAAAMGASKAEVNGVTLNAETQALIDTFRALSTRSYASALGALYAYESQLPGVSTTKIDGLKRFYGVDSADAIRFFTVHETADVEHSAVCRQLLDALPADQREEAIDAGAKLAGALWDFLSGVQHQAGLAC